jgi:RNA polymerase sigma-70 factor (ECF subfamily)
MAFNIDYTHKTDEELVVLSLESQLAFAVLINRYQQKLRGYVSRISNVSAEDGADILQDVFIKIYKNLNNFDTSLKFSSWAYRITRNQCISNFRKLKARPQTIVFDGDNDFLDNIASEFDLDKEMDLLDSKEMILNILSSLDYKYREVLELKFLEEKDYREISDILKKPMGTIATLINRAKKQFRDELSKQNIKSQSYE